MNVKKCKIRSIRESVDSLTDETVKQLNKINRILSEIEKKRVDQPPRA